MTLITLAIKVQGSMEDCLLNVFSFKIIADYLEALFLINWCPQLSGTCEQEQYENSLLLSHLNEWYQDCFITTAMYELLQSNADIQLDKQIPFLLHKQRISKTSLSSILQQLQSSQSSHSSSPSLLCGTCCVDISILASQLTCIPNFQSTLSFNLFTYFETWIHEWIDSKNQFPLLPPKKTDVVVLIYDDYKQKYQPIQYTNSELQHLIQEHYLKEQQVYIYCNNPQSVATPFPSPSRPHLSFLSYLSVASTNLPFRWFSNYTTTREWIATALFSSSQQTKPTQPIAVQQPEPISLLCFRDKLNLINLYLEHKEFVKECKLPPLKPDATKLAIFVQLTAPKEYTAICIRGNIIKLGALWKHLILCSHKDIASMFSLARSISPYIQIHSIDTNSTTEMERDVEVNNYAKTCATHYVTTILYDDDTYLSNRDCFTLSSKETETETRLPKDLRTMDSSCYKIWLTQPQHSWNKFVKRDLASLNQNALVRLQTPFSYKPFDITSFYYRIYHNPINSYLQHRTKFEFDEHFFKGANGISSNKEQIEKYYVEHGIMKGMICHVKAVLRFYPTARFYYNETNTILVEHDHKIEALQEFVQHSIYNKPVTELLMKSVVTVYNQLHYNVDLLMILHIGNLAIATDVLQYIERYYNCQQTVKFGLVAYCVDSMCQDILIQYLQSHFPNSCLLKATDVGSDIIPSFVCFQQASRYITFKYILKLHTKTDKQWRINLMQCFHQIGELLHFMEENHSISVLCNKQYVETHNDFCTTILHHTLSFIAPELRSKILKHFSFVKGTIFLCQRHIFDELLKQHSQLLLSALVIPFYYDNFLFPQTSPMHCIERMFGIIPLLHRQSTLGIYQPTAKRVAIVYACHLKNGALYNIIRYTLLNVFIPLHIPIMLIYSTDIGHHELFTEFYKIPWIHLKQVPNQSYDIRKYLIGIELLQSMQVDYIVLVNDSLTFFKDIRYIITMLHYMQEDLIGLIDCNLIKYHYQSYFLIVSHRLATYMLDYLKLFRYYSRSKEEVIYQFEVSFTNHIIHHSYFSHAVLYLYALYSYDVQYGVANAMTIPIQLYEQFRASFNLPCVKTIYLQQNHQIPYIKKLLPPALYRLIL